MQRLRITIIMMIVTMIELCAFLFDVSGEKRCPKMTKSMKEMWSDGKNKIRIV